MTESIHKKLYAKELFLYNPALTLTDAQFALKHKFGEGLNKEKLTHIRRYCMASPEAVKEEIAESLDTDLLLREAYDFFNRQDITKFTFIDEDIQLFTKIEKAIKHENLQTPG
jgi:hypothetical protein